VWLILSIETLLTVGLIEVDNLPVSSSAFRSESIMTIF
jgi:hypothetical protein